MSFLPGVMGTRWGASVEEAPKWVPMPTQSNLAGSSEELPPVRRSVLRLEDTGVSFASAAEAEVWIASVVRRRIASCVAWRVA